MNRRAIMLSVLIACLLTSAVYAAPSVYKEKKYFGPIPKRNVNFSFGFIDGPDDEYLTDHLEFWAQLTGGRDYFQDISTAPYAQVSYEHQVTPFHFFRGSLSFCYLTNESTGFVNVAVPAEDPPLARIDIDRTLKVYYFSLDIGFGYYLIEPKVRALTPYVSGGFSGAVPVVRLETDGTRTEGGEPFSLPGENVDKTTFQAGIHAEFGMRYLISNRQAAGLEGRYQMSQSKFEIHDGNFDLDHSGLSLAVTYFLYF